MNNPKEFLIEFMNLKKSLISRIGGDLPDYFLPADADEIRGWSAEDAENIAKKIRENLEYNLGFSSKFHPLLVDFCPFCELNNMECEECEYGKVHGTCTKPDSNFRILEQALEESHDCQFNTFNKEIEALIKKYS